MNSGDIFDHDDKFDPEAQRLAGSWSVRLADRNACNGVQSDDRAVSANRRVAARRYPHDFEAQDITVEADRARDVGDKELHPQAGPAGFLIGFRCLAHV